jgi:flagellar hook-length control protein FliK
VETGRVQGDAPVREITLELRLPDYNSSMNQSANQTWEAKAPSALENMLARELHQNFNGDIVRHASMALRDGGKGTINLALKPESLGNVKIQLEMTENKITGLIVVESEEALKAFRKEITSLEQAFKDSGFENADLNLSLSQNGQNQNGWEKETNTFSSQIAASRYDESSFYEDGTLVDVLVERNGSVNMLA